MRFCVTTALEKIRAAEKRITVLQGGTSAGKTIAVLLGELDEAIVQPGILTSVVTDTLPNLKKGAIRDFLNICRDTNILEIAEWSKTDHTLRIPNGSEIEFFSTETMGAHGSRRDRLFVNEANRIPYETYRQLAIRTKQHITIDFNPVNEFWAHTEILKNPEQAKNADFIKLNYRDNEALDESIVEALESMRGDGTSNWWQVYGEGNIGSLEGNVYEGWQPYSVRPKDAILKRYGVDFGFSNDPTAVVAVYEDEKGEIYLELEVLETKLLTPNLVEKLRALQDGLYVCDNARPEIIAELNANGIRAIGCDKTPGEKMNGKRYNIELVQRRKIHYLGTDKELEREYLTYAWRKKKTGEILDEPQDGNDHCMDAISYAIRDMEKKPLQYGSIY